MGNSQDHIAQRVAAYNLKLVTIENKDRKSLEIIWAYPHYINGIELPRQGFKLHITATIINSHLIFDIAIPYLLRNSYAFKVIGTNTLLKKLNNNVFGFSQVGKFITIYPINNEQLIKITTELDILLNNLDGPKIPSDKRLHNNSIIYYRYGVINSRSGTKNQYLISPDGRKIKDTRDPLKPIPYWVEDILGKNIYTDCNKQILENKFIIIKVIRQQAKGGVFLAVELLNFTKTSNVKPQLRRVILKEARRLGELDNEGKDALHRLKWQYEIMQILAIYDISPKVLGIYEKSDGAIISYEFFGKYSFKQLLSSKKLNKLKLLKVLLNVSNMIKRMHSLGFFFFDLSPGNILVGKNNEIKLIDFEYCYNHNAPSFPGWGMGTPGFAPKIEIISKIDKTEPQKLLLRDIYALGNILFAIFNPLWYEALIHNKYSEDLYWGQKFFIQYLPEMVKFIYSKTNFFGYHMYNSIDEFILDLSKVIVKYETPDTIN